MKGFIKAALFFLLGGAIVYVAFALGVAKGSKPGARQVTVDDLRKALRDTSQEARRQAAELLGARGGEAHSAVGDLATALKDKSEKVRCAAAQALGKIGTQAKAAVPALKEALASGSGKVRAAVQEALRRVKAPAEKRNEKTDAPAQTPRQP